MTVSLVTCRCVRMRLGTLLCCFLGILGLLLFLALKVEETDAGDGRQRRPKRLARDVGEKITLRQHGLYGVDLISCERVRIENKKVGFLSLGGFKELVVDDLRVTLVHETAKDGQDPGGGQGTEESIASSTELFQPREFAKRLGFPRVSGLRINRLTLSVLEGTNVVPRVIAQKGYSQEGGLGMSECDIIQFDVVDYVGQAVLKFGKRPKVVWSGGEVDL